MGQSLRVDCPTIMRMQVQCPTIMRMRVECQTIMSNVSEIIRVNEYLYILKLPKWSRRQPSVGTTS